MKERLTAIDAEVLELFGSDHVMALKRLREGEYQPGDGEKFSEVMDYYMQQRCMH
jgi:hypothetical protein